MADHGEQRQRFGIGIAVGGLFFEEGERLLEEGFGRLASAIVYEKIVGLLRECLGIGLRG
jgi:hypothetical protein